MFFRRLDHQADVVVAVCCVVSNTVHINLILLTKFIFDLVFWYDFGCISWFHSGSMRKILWTVFRGASIMDWAVSVAHFLIACISILVMIAFIRLSVGISELEELDALRRRLQIAYCKLPCLLHCDAVGA